MGIKSVLTYLFTKQGNNHFSLPKQIPDLYSADFIDDFYALYPQLLKKDVVFFEKSNCYGVFKYNIVKTVLSNSELFSSRHLQKPDKVLVGASHKIHTNNKKTIYSSLSMLYDNQSEKDIQLIEEILNILFQETLKQTNVKINIVDWLVNPFTFTYILYKLGLNEAFQELNILDRNGNFVEKITSIKKVFNNSTFVNAIAATSVERDKMSPELKDIIEKINHDKRYSTEDIVQFLRLLILAGTETTASLIASSIYLLRKESDKLNKKNLVKEDNTELNAFINEVLRYFSPAQFTFRVAEKDISIGETQIPENSLIAVSIGAANRDTLMFSQPNSFVLNRKEKHIAFGFSKHRCVGENLTFFMTQKFIKHYLDYERLFDFDDDISTNNSVFSFKIDQLNAILK